MSFPTIPGTCEMVRRHRDKQGFTNAQLATALAAFGWVWTEDHVEALMNGTRKPTADEEAFFKLFLLDAFHDYNCS